MVELNEFMLEPDFFPEEDEEHPGPVNGCSTAEPGLPDLKFSDLLPSTQEVLKSMDWPAPMPVQAKVVPYLLQDQDVIVQSKTGSGKTGAFLLPLLEKIDPNQHHCQVLVMVPTRELAVQIMREWEKLTSNRNLPGMAIYGGVNFGPQIEACKKGVPFLVGTPGRILDHLGRRTLTLDRLDYLVLDEADELLSMGFYKDMTRILSYLPKDRVSAMFSATMPESVKRLAGEFLQQPKCLSLSEDTMHVTDMDHIYYTVDPMYKDRAMMKVIELENPPNGIIFCNTKAEVDYLASFLTRFGYSVEQISGDLSQAQREIVMGHLRTGKIRFLVATDLAARGIDISDLEYVFIYDFHKDFEQYVHRAGRTGRAGKRGLCISFLSLIEEADFKRHARRYGLDYTNREAPSDAAVQARLCERLLFRLEAEQRDANSAQRERAKRFEQLLEAIKTHEFGDEILLMLLDGFAEAIKRQGRPQPPPPQARPNPAQHAARRSGPRRGAARQPGNRGFTPHGLPTTSADTPRSSDQQRGTAAADKGMPGTPEQGSGGVSKRGGRRRRR